MYIVTEKAKRPASDKEECFYCKRPIGMYHENNCVLIRKKIKISFTIILEDEVPSSFDKHDIEFRYNDSSYCLDNLFEKIEEIQKIDGCLCNRSRVDFLETISRQYLKEE